MTQPLWIALIGCLTLAGLLGGLLWAWVRQRSRGAKVSRDDWAQVQAQIQSLQVERAVLQERLTAQEQEYRREYAHWQQDVEQRSANQTILEKRLGETQEELFREREMVVRLQAQNQGLSGEFQRYREDESARAELLREQLQSLSQRIFTERTESFAQVGTEAIAQLVNPVREQLLQLQASVQESDKTEAVRAEQLRGALQQVLDLNGRLGAQAEQLSQALRGDNRMVGELGEVLLGRLLEVAGLRKGEHFVEQGQGLGLKADDVGTLRPDVLLFLPEGRCLVVDAKMSLLSWSDAQGTDPEQRQEALLKFRQSCRRHVLDLASKDYVGAVRERGLESLDFRFLFVPIEAAFQTVLQEDRDLYSFAFANKVILTSPTTLLAMLTTVQHTWKQYDIGKNAQAISERAGRMLDKLSDMVQAMDEMGRCLEKAQKQYHTTRGRLSDGAGNLLGQARKLQSLGVRGQKGLPSGGEDSVLDALD